LDPLLLQVLNGHRPSQTPVWFMRQAGRFLPEYREVRKQYTFDQVLNDPQLSKLVTLQPIQRFPKLDGAIIFSDILIVLNALGCRVSFEHGSPSIGRTLDQISIDDAVDYSHFDTVQKALEATRLDLPSHVTLIGFAGAPWTLFAYACDGSNKNGWQKAKEFLSQKPLEAEAWLNKISKVTRDLLMLQIGAGAQVVQLFDSWAGDLSQDEYLSWALPFAEMTLKDLKVPRIYFPKMQELPPQLQLFDCEALSISWESRMSLARSSFPRKILQGNLDPKTLLGEEDQLIKSVQSIMDEMKGHGHIFNLGHGILPKTDPGVIQQILDMVKP
jgi:uroporphyrinogen decarboxylase